MNTSEENSKVIVGHSPSTPLKSFPAKYRLLTTMLQTQGHKPIMYDTEGAEYKTIADSLGVKIVNPAQKKQDAIAEMKDSGEEVRILDIDPELDFILHLTPMTCAINPSLNYWKV